MIMMLRNETHLLGDVKVDFEFIIKKKYLASWLV